VVAARRRQDGSENGDGDRCRERPLPYALRDPGRLRPEGRKRQGGLDSSRPKGYRERETHRRGIVTDWTKRNSPIQVGDTVGYSKPFLQSTAQYAGDVPHARGKVTALVPVGDTLLAEIEWDTPDLPKRVNVKNLSTRKQIALGE
jgi:hypothetical protein